MSTALEQNLAAAMAYYRGFEQKDPDAIARHLHPDVRFKGPLAELTGKAAVAEAAKRLSTILRGITFRAQFAAGQQVMLAYDLHCLEPIGLQPAAVLMSFRDGLIAELQLYYDPRPFEHGLGAGAVFLR